MEIELRNIGSTIVEISIVSNAWTIAEEITDMSGRIDQKLIDSLETIIEEMKTHNKEINRNDQYNQKLSKNANNIYK